MAILGTERRNAMRMSEMADSHDDVTRDDGYIKIRAADAKPGQKMRRNCAPDAEIIEVDTSNPTQTVIYKKERRREEEIRVGTDADETASGDYENTCWSYRPDELIDVRPLAA